MAQAGVSPVAIAEVLYGARVARRDLGASLQMFGQDRDGSWLVGALIEATDRYTVYGARYIDEDEIAAIEQIRRP